MSKFLLLLLCIGSPILFSSIAFTQVVNPASNRISKQTSTQVPNIAGDWKMSIAGDGDNKSATCVLIQTGNILTGTFKGPMGDLPISGTVTNDKKLTFSAKFMMGSLKFAGTIDGKTMKGIVDLPMGRGRKSWTANK
jgi:hypothetical protein